MDEGHDKEALVNRLLAVFGLVALMACGGGDSTATPSGPTSLQIEDLTVGTGATAAVGDTVSVGYIGTFLDGQAPPNPRADIPLAALFRFAVEDLKSYYCEALTVQPG